MGPSVWRREDLGRLRRKNKQTPTPNGLLWKRATTGFAREADEAPGPVYEFVRAHQAGFPVATMCCVLKVSSSG